MVSYWASKEKIVMNLKDVAEVFRVAVPTVGK